MSSIWPIELVVDAHGGDEVRAYPRRNTPDGTAHVAVRAGPVLVHCLDARALQDSAAAWARAVVLSEDALPSTPHPVADPLREAAGYGSPAGIVMAEGPQRWEVHAPHPDHPFTTVSSPWLTVRVHDQKALDAHVRAWAFGTDLAQLVYRSRPVPFNRLLEQARDRKAQDWYEADQRRGRGRSR